MHQFLVLFFGSIMPISAIIYSLMNGLNQKKRVMERDDKGRADTAYTRRSTYTSLLDEESEEQPDSVKEPNLADPRLAMTRKAGLGRKGPDSQSS